MAESSQEKEKYLGIKQVSLNTGLPASTIRYYDQQFEEFLELKRGSGRRRLFTEEAVERLLVVHRLLKEDGLSLRQARKEVLEGGFKGPSQKESSREIEDLRQEVDDLRRQFNELREIQKRTLALFSGLTKD
ncbi:MerR family transcriptional regulator [Dethiosulfatarculus sandiegensis]|uniref:Transcriptional regulator n=1 Tax=Dethiosulfatarculus sandiegensis TaxID=1429043 RepID=A0A0D2J8P9_9BACT|nr:MerR family transcriptional regulator [Dethiosulfatarculus sandiegensis]KIX12091.1 transcriptional regulator [Dethiosulfatarculus sandiegensis]